MNYLYDADFPSTGPELWVSLLNTFGNEKITPDIQSGIEDHKEEIQTEQDMRRVIRELRLRR